ncbi:transposase (plasmid) [Rhizobium sp. L51/94]|nr:transposase [Rhizobium sp. L51/94]
MFDLSDDLGRSCSGPCLREIARHVDEDAHTILIMHQAGWHMSNNLVVSENITILSLPPKSQELNPVENLWDFMRENGS